MRTQIDIKRLRYIVEIARCESITTAAEMLSLTQPALTRSVAEVEAELGTKLFHRMPRGVQLTEAGQRFVQRARQVIVDVDDLIHDIKDSSDALSGRLRIGMAPAAYSEFALPELTTIAEHHPEVRIDLIGGSVQEMCPRLLRGELNLLIGPLSYLKRWKELDIVEVRKQHLAVLLKKDHPLSKQAKVQEAELLSYPVILPSSVEPLYSDTAQRYAHHEMHPPQPRYTCDSFETVKALLNASDAFFPMHYPYSVFDRLREQFTVLQGVLQLPAHTICLAKTSQQPASAEAKLFESLLLERHGINTIAPE